MFPGILGSGTLFQAEKASRIKHLRPDLDRLPMRHECNTPRKTQLKQWLAAGAQIGKVRRDTRVACNPRLHPVPLQPRTPTSTSN